MTDYLLLYSGGSTPETEEEQKTVMDACYSIISADPLDAASTWRRAVRCCRAVPRSPCTRPSR